MVSQTVNQIISAEKLAAEKVDAANKSAELIIAQANQKAKDIMDEAYRDSAAEASRLMQSNKTKIDAVMTEHRVTPDEDLAIRAHADEKKDRAIEMVIRTITKQ